MKKLFLILILLLTVIPMGAVGQRDNIPITKVRVDRSGLVTIDFSANATQYGTPPACATVTNRMTADSNTAGGKAILQAALTAYLSGRQVYLEGTGTCSEFSTLESINILQLH